MAGINVPRRRQDNSMGNLLTLGGMAAGAAFGGPAGAATGGSIGGMVGGMMQQPQAEGPGGVGPDSESAMQRRMMAKQDDSLQVLRESVNALPQLPEPIRQEYARPIMTAYAAEAKKRGVNPWEGMS